MTDDATSRTRPRPDRLRVFLADDQSLVRSGFRMLIEAEDDMTVVGEAGDGAEAVRKLTEQPADVVLMDIRMPLMDGVEATRRLVGSGSPTKVLVLTTFDLDEYVFSALKAGAAGVLLKDDREREVLVEIARGATNSEIAERLFMAEGTVKTHVGRLLSKLGCRDRVGLVLLAFETGLVRHLG